MLAARRRVTITLVMTLLLSLGLPAGAVPAGGSFPLGWLWSALSDRSAWADLILQPPLWRPSDRADRPLHDTSAHRGAGAPGKKSTIAVPEAQGGPSLEPRRTPRLGQPDLDLTRSTRVDAASTETSDVYQSADGGFVRKVTQDQRNVKQADGTWQPIDRTVAQRGDKRFAQRTAGRTEISSAPSSTDPDLVRLGVDGGGSIAYGLEGAADVRPVTEANAVTYPQIVPGVDLKLEMLADAAKESLILHSAQAQSSFTFPLRTNGLTPSLGGNGSVLFTDARGAVKASMPAGFMTDAKFDQASGDFVRSNSVRYELIRVHGRPALKVDLDAQWLRDPARVYPVTVDPSAYFYDTGDTYVYKTDTADHGSENNLPIGTYDSGTHVARSLLQFANFDTKFNGKSLSTAYLKLKLTWAYNCTPSSFSVKLVSSSWSMTGVAWPGPSTSTTLGTYTPDPGSACTNSSGDRSVGPWVYVPLDLTALQAWANGGANYGLELVTSETNSAQWKRFTSRNYANYAYEPSLLLYYDGNIAPQIYSMYPPYNYASETLTPTLSVKAFDFDGTHAPFTYHFTVTDDDTDAVVADSNKISGSSWTVPPGLLTWGKSYTWGAVVNDSISDSTKVEYPLRTPVPQPLLTSSLSQNGGRGFSPAIGNYTTSALDVSVSTVGPPLSIERAYNSSDPRTGQSFGMGWSSMLDSRVNEVTDGSGNPGVLITYPTGNEAKFARNPGVAETYSPPGGRYASFSRLSASNPLTVPGSADITTGFKLVDKQATVFGFTAALPGGGYGLSHVVNANRQVLRLDYTSGRVSQLISQSGRTLSVTWATPAGAASPHVTAVATDQAMADPNSRSVYTYNYTGDLLTGACPATSTTACTHYEYNANSNSGSAFPLATRNLGPTEYYRLNELSGTTAATDQATFANGTYSGVTLGQPSGPLSYTDSKVAQFNGTTSVVDLPPAMSNDNTQRSVSVWFKTGTAGGVITGQSMEPLSGAGQFGYTPTLFVGTNGRLRGQFPTVPTKPTGTTPTPIGTLIGAMSGKCVDDTGAGTTDGNLLQLYTCGTSQPQQLWSWSKDGELSITIGGVRKCVDAGAMTKSTQLAIKTCNAGTAQKWDLVPNGYIQHAGTGFCMDANGGGTANGTRLILWSCASGTAWNQAWYSSFHAPLESPTTVNDNNWHHAVLTSAATATDQVTQTLYLDGAFAASQIGMRPASGQKYQQLGAGFSGASWNSASYAGSNKGTKTNFTGYLAEAAFFARPLSNADVSALYAARNTRMQPLIAITTPLGKTKASVAYDFLSGRVQSVTDEVGGLWQIGQPTLSGAPDVYANAVRATGPTDYWRLADSSGDTAVNEIDGGGVTYYSSTSLGSDAGPFDDTAVDSDNGYTRAATFDGTSSYLKLPVSGTPGTGPNSVSLWFRSTSTSSGVLYSYQNADPSGSPTAWIPALYLGNDGKLHGSYWWGTGTNNNTLTSAAPVNDGKWHHVVLTGNSTSTVLYLDGATVGTHTGAMVAQPTDRVLIGAGKTTSWPGSSATMSYFKGQIAEVSVYTKVLTSAQVASLGAAAKESVGPALSRKYGTTNPGNRTSYELLGLATGQNVVTVNELGKRIVSTYDENGFLYRVIDPLGHGLTTERDVRGNVIHQISCQDEAGAKCSHTYFTYYPDATTKVLSPDPRNDLMMTQRGPGPIETEFPQPTAVVAVIRDAKGNTVAVSSHALPPSTTPGGNTKITNQYDAQGNLIAVTDQVDRTMVNSYSGLGDIAAVGGGTVPPGLPVAVMSASGAVSTLAYRSNGDVAYTIDPAGKRTDYTYDGLGRVVSQTDTTDTFPGGITLQIEYDKQSRVLRQTGPGVSNAVTGAVHTAQTENAFDDDGNLTSALVRDLTGGDASRGSSFTYNGVNLKDSATDPAGKVTHFTYDAFGRVETVTDNGGLTARHHFDDTGQPTSTELTNWTGSPSGSIAATTLVTEQRVYDDAGRIARITDREGDSTDYTYTDNGLVSKVTRNSADGTQHFIIEQNTYDPAGYLIEKLTDNGATKTQFKVDGAGRTLASTLDPGGLNRVVIDDLGTDNQVLNSVTTTNPDGTGAVLARRQAVYDQAGRIVAKAVYNADPATTPMARWRLDETTGTTAADASGNSIATATNVTWTNDATRAAYTAVFNGTSSLVDIPAAVVDTAQSYSYTAWVKLAAKGSDRQVLSVAGGLGTPALGLFYQASSDRWVAQVGTRKTDLTLNTTSLSSTSSPSTGTWTHLAVTADAATRTVKLYVGGTLQATAVLGEPLNNHATGTRIGSQNGAAWFSGAVSDVHAYGSALTAAQVTSLVGTAWPVTGTVNRQSFQIDQGGLAVATTDQLGNISYVTYDKAGRVVQASTPAFKPVVNGVEGASTRGIAWTGYDTFGEPTNTKDAYGNQTQTQYRADGLTSKVIGATYTLPRTSTTITPQTSYTYDTSGRTTKVTDPDLHDTLYEYDQLGRTTKVTAPDGKSTTYSYLADHEQWLTDPTGAVSKAFTDYLGRTLRTVDVVRRPGGSDSFTTTLTYDPAGRLAKQESPSLVKQVWTYNNAGEVLTVKDQFDKVTTNSYDAAGRQTRVTLPDGTYTTAEYDLAGNVTAREAHKQDNTLLTRITADFDRAGKTTRMVDARGNATTFAYDELGRLTQQNEPVSAGPAITSKYRYDLNGNLTQVENPNGQQFITTYNAWNLPEDQIEPVTPTVSDVEGRRFTNVYGATGRLVKQVQPGAIPQGGGARTEVTLNYQYDVAGRLTAKSGTGAETATATQTFGYDDAGRVTLISGSGGDNLMTYDDRGLLRSVNGPSGNTAFTYNSDGQMATRTDTVSSTNTTTSYSYTGGLLSQVSNPDSKVTVGYTYNSLQQPTQLTYGNGNIRALAYDDLHRLTSDELRTAAAPAGASVSKIVYAWDGNSNLIGKTTTGFGATAISNTYTYDPANRLIGWDNGTTVTAYGYDLAGNRTSAGGRTFQYDQRNQLTSASGGTSYSYTARGTLSSTTTGTVAMPTVTDAFGQVKTQYSGAAAHTDYSYDGLGRMVGTGLSYSGTGNTLASDGTATYTRGPGDDLLGVMQGGSKTYAWTDQHTDVVGQFDSSGTTPVSTLSGVAAYDPLGKVLSSPAFTLTGHLGYQSGWTDTASGRVNMLSRWYNTDTGQFDTRDTQSNSSSPVSVNANRFAYANANPLTFTDPTGHAVAPDDPRGTPNKPDTSKDPNPTDNCAHNGAGLGSASCEPLPEKNPDKDSDARCGLASGPAYCAEKKEPVSCPHTGSNTFRVVGDNCTEVTTPPDGNTVVINDVTLHRSDLGGIDVDDLVYQVDKLGGTYKDYDDPKQRQLITAMVFKDAAALSAARQTQLDAAVKQAKCDASFWCRNSGAISIGLTVLAAVATIATGGIAGILIGIAAAVVINVATDFMHQDINSWSDLGRSAFVGLVSGVASAVTGGAAGAIAGKFVAKALVAKVVSGAIAGAVSGGAASAVTQLALTGTVDFNQVLLGAATGAVAGAAGGAAGGRGLKLGRGCGGDLAGVAVGAAASVHSFALTTRVLMADGSTKQIKDVALGDKVASTDPDTGQTTSQPVTVLHRHIDLDLADLTLSTQPTGTPQPAPTTGEGNGDRSTRGPTTSVLHTTQHHPFWDSSTSAWVNASELQPGKSTLVGPDGSTLYVASVKNFTDSQEMRDLTVDTLHTYYVLADNHPVLVHNCNGGFDAKGNKCSCAAENPTNWNTNSRPTWGHTFSEHGAGVKNTRSLTDRARSTGNDQGQWSNDADAASFLRRNYDPSAGPRKLPLPAGMGTVIRPNGTVVPATHVQLVPGTNGPYKSAFPIVLEE